MGGETCVSIIKGRMSVMGWLNKYVSKQRSRSVGQDSRETGRYNRITVPGVGCGLFIGLCGDEKTPVPTGEGAKEVRRGG